MTISFVFPQAQVQRGMSIYMKYLYIDISYDGKVVKRPRSWYNNPKEQPDAERRREGLKLLKKHVKWFMDHVTQDRLDSTSAHGAFFLIISFLPFIAFLLTLMQQIHFPSSGMTLIDAALGIFPDTVASYLQGLLPSPLESSGVLPVAVITAVWSSSMGMVAIIKGLDQIFHVEETRGYIHLRVIAVVYVLVFAVVLLAAAALLVFGSTIYTFLLKHSPPFFATILMNFKSLAGFVMLFLFFTLMYSCVPRRRVKFIHNLAGAAFSAAGWVLFSFFFSLFVENFSNFSIYGSLATLVILMFWLFFCMYIMFLGAEVSMWLEHSGIGTDLKNLSKKRRKKRERKKREAKAGAKSTDSIKE